MSQYRDFQGIIGKEVHTNQRLSVLFKSTPCIGTEMTGGTVLFVITRTAAICGHFDPPRDSTSLDESRTEIFTTALLSDINTWREFFPLESATAWIFYEARSPVSPAREELMRSLLSEKHVDGSKIAIIPYQNRGTAFVAVDSKGNNIRMYLNNAPVSF